ncbi:hypothetical protein EVAR_56101_1 [Eumeta japonica]|uniref:Uncharacterized protein n=1 Tax=Eumeta variegata TaxID=151549 RepID=A0A4C1YF29_EUMVA|nr:hypothetical protein EVAR_56101_1 [Eumeta japonica]
MAFSGVLLFGLRKDDLRFMKSYYISFFIAIAIVVCYFINGFILNIVISLFNLGVRVYVLYILTKLLEEMQRPGHPTV